MRPKLLAVIATLAVACLALAGGATGSPALAGPNCTIDATIDSEELAFLGLINQHRADNGRGPLALSDTLNRAAAWKSWHLGTEAYFAHDDTPINRTWVQRIRDCGYNYSTGLGENIAAGNSSAQATFLQWRNSPGHNANMLSSGYTAIGIGRAYVAGSPYSWYWTTDFGGVSDGYSGSGDPTSTPSQAAATATRTPTRTATRTPTRTPTRTSTRTPTGTIVPPDCADMNGDGRVRIYDVTLIVDAYGTSTSLADINNDGVVNSNDVSAAVLAFGSSCTR
jgi:uncharacterized protein YkwD